VCAWASVVVSHLRFRRIRIRNGEEDRIRSKMPFSPYGNYLALVFIAAVTICIAVLPDTRTSLLVSGAWVLVVFIAYKLDTRTDRNRRRDRGRPVRG